MTTNRTETPAEARAFWAHELPAGAPFAPRTADEAAARECTACRYTSGHTSWCPNGDGSPLVTAAEQAAIDEAIAGRTTPPTVLRLVEVAAMVNEDATTNGTLMITALGSNVVGLHDLANGLLIVMNEGQLETDTAVEGFASVVIVHEGDLDVEVARCDECNAPEDVFELYAGVVGRG